MDKRNFITQLQKAYQTGKISVFVYHIVYNNSKEITDSTFLDEIYKDALMMGKSINSKEDLQRYIGAQNVVPFFVDKLGVNLSAEDLRRVYERVSEKGTNDVMDVAQVVFRYVNDKRRVAYPTELSFKHRVIPEQNIKDWIGRISNIYKFMSKGFAKEDLISQYTQDMDSTIKQDFRQWMKYYEDGDQNKYNVDKNMRKNANVGDPDYLDMLNTAFNTRQEQAARDEEYRAKRDEAHQNRIKIKQKILARLQSIRKLLNKYTLAVDNAIANKYVQMNDDAKQKTQDYSELAQAINGAEEAARNLGQTMNMTGLASSAVDKIYKSANIAKASGLNEIHQKLYKTARKFEKSARELDEAAIEPSENLAGLEKEKRRKPDVLEELKGNANPNAVLEKLESLLQTLQKRDLIRELSEVDIMLNELSMASYFPELAFGQSKLIDGFGYASNKLEDAISKIRGGLREEEQKMQPIDKLRSPKVETPKFETPKMPEIPSAPSPTGDVEIVKGEPPTGGRI